MQLCINAAVFRRLLHHADVVHNSRRISETASVPAAARLVISRASTESSGPHKAE